MLRPALALAALGLGRAWFSNFAALMFTHYGGR